MSRSSVASNSFDPESSPAKSAARVRYLLLPYLALVFVHWLSGMQMEQPIILADELGYLGNARYLAGAAHLPDMQGAQFYHFGYSLLLLPAFWLFSDPDSIYRAALVINALVMSALYMPLFALLTGLLEVPRRIAIWIAMVCCLYPPLVLFSNFAWSENAFIPMYALTVVLFGKYLRSQSVPDAVLFSAAATFLYAIHPRALPILVAVVAYLLLLAVLQVLPRRQVLLSVTTLGLFFVLTKAVNDHLMATGWAGEGEFSAARLATRILPGSQFTSFILRAAGQGLYLSLATQGLFLLGLIGVIGYLCRRSLSTSTRRVLADPRTGMLIFLVITATGVFLASVTTKVFSLYGVNTIRATNFIYGRYNEAAAVLFMALGLVQLWRGRMETRQAARRVLAITSIILGLTALVMIDVRTAQEALGPEGAWTAEAANLAGVFPLVDTLGLQKLYLISLVAIASYLGLTVLARFSYSGALLLLALLFFSYSLYTERFNLRSARASSSSRLSFVAHMARLGPVPAVSYDFAHLDRQVFYGSQFLLQDTVFNRFRSTKGEKPDSEIVISGNQWRQADRLNAKFIVSAADGDTALWVLPGETQSSLSTPPYDGVNLGVEPRFGIQGSGFYQPEWFEGVPARWTNGAATLKVPLDPQNLPQVLEIETIGTGRDGTRLEVVANGIELWNEWIPEIWSGTFSLAQVPPGETLILELNNATINPEDETRRSIDDRSLGVLVRAIRLQALATPPPTTYESLVLGAEPVPGIQETGFYSPEPFDDGVGRWTTGIATIRVPLDPQNLPRVLALEVSAPGRGDATRLQVLANGTELWDRRIPDHGWSRSFRLDRLEMWDVLLIELKSDSFTPSQTLEGSTDRRTLGVVVKGIRLTGHEAFPEPIPDGPPDR